MSPSDERVRIFAYGSNMCLPHVEDWARSERLVVPKIVESRAARLADFKLAWNYHSKRRNCGAANVVREVGREVHGVLITTDEAGLATIDRKESHPIRYLRTLLQVEADGALVEAWVYQVTERFVLPQPVWPNREYLDLLLAGARAHGLPEDYVSLLASVPVVEAA